MNLSKKLEEVLSKINNAIAQELLTYEGTRYESLDVTGDNSTLMTSSGKHRNAVKISKAIKYLFGDKYTDKEIFEFTGLYKKELDFSSKPETTKVSALLKWTIDTFTELTTETYPYGHEEEVWPLLNLSEFTKDKYGNYYKVVGDDPTTMFTSHLDTASQKKEKTGFRLGQDRKTGDVWAYTDGTTILGADDKSGCVVMMHMLRNNIPGIYYFFIGEERGAIGSYALASDYDKYEHLVNVKKCISFDRRDFYSVITSQLGRPCCSSEFGQSLADQLNLGMSLDPTGVFTDSASFLDLIPECTNVSVGYFNEHTGQERQNLTYLSKLCDAVTKVDWANLPVARKLDIDDEFKIKYKTIISLIKSNYFNNDVRMYGEDGFFYISITIEEGPLDHFYSDLQKLNQLLRRNQSLDYFMDLGANQIKIKFI